MKTVKVYEYVNCTTCKKALKFLTNNHKAVERVDIFKNPPTVAELKKMVKVEGGNFKKLFNTAGHVYQEMNLTDKIKTMTEDEAIALLSKNGKLVKRPFILFDDTGLVGFDEKKWKEVFKKA